MEGGREGGRQRDRETERQRDIMGGGVILCIKESIQVYEITLKSEADCDETIWYNIFTKNSTLTIGVVYRSPNI